MHPSNAAFPFKDNATSWKKTQAPSVKLFATSENCEEINNSGFVIVIANGFRDDPKADNMVQMPSPSVARLSREIGLYHFLFLSWSKWQVPHAVFIPELQ